MSKVPTHGKQGTNCTYNIILRLSYLSILICPLVWTLVIILKNLFWKECFNIWHTHLVGLFWTSDQLASDAAIYTTRTTNTRQTFMPSVGFEPSTLTIKWLPTYTLDRTAVTGISKEWVLLDNITRLQVSANVLTVPLTMKATTTPLQSDPQHFWMTQQSSHKYYWKNKQTGKGTSEPVQHSCRLYSLPKRIQVQEAMEGKKLWSTLQVYGKC